VQSHFRNRFKPFPQRGDLLVAIEGRAAALQSAHRAQLSILIERIDIVWMRAA
jgi:hypothetical protein